MNTRRRHPPALPRRAAPVSAVATAPVSAPRVRPVTSAKPEAAETPSQPIAWSQVAIWSAALLGVFAWAYWPTLVELVDAWDREPDYSHGYLVVPLAVWFLWVRRDKFPGIDRTYAWVGLAIVGFSAVARAWSASIASSFDGWSILVWVFGVVWLLFGHRVARWSLPSIAFLAFMVPVPFFAERSFSLPLQRVATQISVGALQFLGQPAIAEGNVILLGEHKLEVAQACSGLRIFIGIVALAFAYLVVVRRVWWQKILIILAIAPIALIANATRIVMTGLLFELTSSKAAHRFSHDFAGWVMIPLAAGLFGLMLWYLDKLVRVEQLDDPMSMRSGEPAGTTASS